MVGVVDRHSGQQASRVAQFVPQLPAVASADVARRRVDSFDGHDSLDGIDLRGGQAAPMRMRADRHAADGVDGIHNDLRLKTFVKHHVLRNAQRHEMPFDSVRFVPWMHFHAGNQRHPPAAVRRDRIRPPMIGKRIDIKALA